MPPESGDLQFGKAGVPWENLFRDAGVSDTIGTQGGGGWHWLNSYLSKGESLVMVTVNRIGRRIPARSESKKQAPALRAAGRPPGTND